jgi:hypothetical protein
MISTMAVARKLIGKKTGREEDGRKELRSHVGEEDGRG